MIRTGLIGTLGCSQLLTVAKRQRSDDYVEYIAWSTAKLVCLNQNLLTSSPSKPVNMCVSCICKASLLNCKLIITDSAVANIDIVYVKVKGEVRIDGEIKA